MDKKKAISVITKAAKLYHENLEDQKVLFVKRVRMYGICHRWLYKAECA